MMSISANTFAVLAVLALNRYGARRIQAQAQLQEDARAGRRFDRLRAGTVAEGTFLLRAETSRQPPALRLSPRVRRRAVVLGRPQRAVARSENQASGNESGRPSD